MIRSARVLVLRLLVGINARARNRRSLACSKRYSSVQIFIKFLRHHQARTLLTLAHLADSLTGFVGLLRLPAAHVVAVAQDVADGGGGGLEASWEMVSGYLLGDIVHW